MLNKQNLMKRQRNMVLYNCVFAGNYFAAYAAGNLTVNKN